MIRRSARSRFPILALAAALAGSAAPASTPPQGQRAGVQEGPAAREVLPNPSPGPQHAVLARQVGTWDARVERRVAPGKRVERSRAKETVTLCCGGLFLLTDFDGKVDRRPLHSHSVIGYDSAGGRYTLARVNSTRAFFETGEGSYDDAQDALTFDISVPDGKGGMTRSREVMTWKGRDTRTLTVYGIGPEGQETVDLKVAYRRRR